MAKDETIIKALPPGPGLAFADFYERQLRQQLYEVVRIPREFLEPGTPSSCQAQALIAQMRKEWRG